jgi:hypothetical protein
MVIPMLRVNTRIGDYTVPAFVLGDHWLQLLDDNDFEELPDDVQGEILASVEDHVDGAVEHVALIESAVN